MLFQILNNIKSTFGIKKVQSASSIFNRYKGINTYLRYKFRIVLYTYRH